MLKNILCLSLIVVSFQGRADNMELPVDTNVKDYKKISNLLPTTYFVPQEKDISCKGQYSNSGPVYKGTEKTKIQELDGTVIATVCTRFFKYLAMEGSAVLTDRGHGEVAVNYSGAVGATKRFHALDRCTFGEGTKRDLCLLPYHTLAADNNIHKIGDIIFIPKAVGLVLEDGSKHEGFFIVRDTGGAFRGAGAQRVDMFTGTDPDNDNAFREAGFDRRNPMEAFKVNGDSAEVIKLKLKEKFGELY
jgi:3D (Asp-Asp-Asp) domain-containing protein